MQLVRHTSRGRAAPRAGSALVFVLISMIGMVMIVMVIQQLGLRSESIVSSRVDGRRAFYLAEAALSEGMTAVRAGATGSVARADAPAYLGGGVVWVQSTPLAGGRTQLVATAMAGRGRAAMEAVVEIAAQDPLFQTVLNSREQMTLNSTVVIDSFDSSVGSYASQAVNNANGHTYANADGDVASNAGIVLNSDATVFGDATPGPGSSVAFASGSYVSGSTAPATEAFAFPPIDVPVVASSGPFSLSNNGSATLPAGTHAFDDVSIGRNAVLTIEGPATVVMGDFEGGRDGRLAIDARNGPVTLIIEGTYTHLLGFEAVPVEDSPMAVAFMLTGTQDIVFPNQARVRGAFYAPNANILFSNANEAWGSFAGNRVDMSSSMRFHYDEHLADYWSTAGGDSDPLDVLLWRTVAFEPAALLRNRRDPFALLGLEREDLPTPAEAWDL